MVDHVFPEDEGTGATEGDWNDAANFSQLAEAVGHKDFVVRGLNIQNVDYSALTFDVSQGVAVVSQASATANNTSESRDGAAFVAEADARTGLALTDAAVNYVYLDVDLTTDDTISIVVNTTGSKPAEPSLKLGEVDTSNNTSSETNRKRKLGKAEAQLVEFPDGSVTSPKLTFSNDTDTGIFRPAGDTVSVATGGSKAADFGPAGDFTLPNGDIQLSGNHARDVSAIHGATNTTHKLRLSTSDVRIGVDDGAGAEINALRLYDGGDVEAPNGNFSVADDNDVLFGTADDYGWHYDSTNSRLELVSDPTGTPTDILRISSAGIFSPNRDLYMNDNHIRRVESIRMSGDGNFDSIFTTGAPLRIYSNNTAQNLAWFRENGNAQFPHGSVTQGNDPQETITETTSPKSFNFDGSINRDIHNRTDVTISNGTTNSVTEDITVELYDGADTTGTLMQSETQSVTVSASGTTTVSFITNDEYLDLGTYHIEITQSGTTLSVDQTDEFTRGATYTLQQRDTGVAEFVDQYGRIILSLNPIYNTVKVKNGPLIADNGLELRSNATDTERFGLKYKSGSDDLLLTNREVDGNTILAANTGTAGGDAEALEITSPNGRVMLHTDLMNTTNAKTIYDSTNEEIPATAQEAGERIVASGTATLSGGSATVSTGVTTTGTNLNVRLDPSGNGNNAADVKAAARIFWDNANGNYKVEILEDGTSVGNPDIGYEVTKTA